MASLTARRPTLPGADFATASGQRSPLDQLELGVSMRRDSLSTSPPVISKSPTTPETPKVIPSLNLNLFRSPSIYSVESSDSVSLASSDDYDSADGYGYGVTSEPESDSDCAHDKPITFTTASSSRNNSPIEGRHSRNSSSGPSTPRGPRHAATATAAAAAESPLASGSTTPRGARKVSTHNFPYAFGSVRSAISDAPFTLREAPVRSARSLSVSTSNATITIPPTSRSCSAPGPRFEAHEHDAPVSRYPETAIAPDCASVHGEQGSDWGDDEAGFEWLDTDDAPDAGVEVNANPKNTSRLRSAIAQPMLTVKRSVSVRSGGRGARSPLTPKSDLPNSTDEVAPAPERRRTKKSHHVVIPRRPAPPPPPGVGFVAPVEQTRSRSPAMLRTGGIVDRNSPHHYSDFNTGSPIRTIAPADDPLPPVVIIDATPPRPGPQATMVPMNDNSPTRQNIQSLAPTYSFYALDDESPPRSATSETIPRGRYAKVAVPNYGSPVTTPTRTTPTHTRVEDVFPRRSSADTHRAPSLSTPMGPDELVAAGLERRDAGDLPKSSWLFMRAAQEGNPTGRIYYGIALKYGMGIAKDEKKAVAMLSTAVENENIPGLAVGLAELGNCHLEGIGTKRVPEKGVEYLRRAGGLGDMTVQEQLGHILSKGVGVKKDMYEAAKWYRLALRQGSNIPGLAWVWKEKYGK